jgi:hypothetical protein
MVLQSAEVDTLENNTINASANVSEQILGFVDDVPGVDMNIPQPLYRTLPDKTFNSDLGEFLSRPTMIHEFTWNEGSAVTGTTIDPWTLFMNNATIKKKIDNYAYMRCNLKLKFVINASPFYYGALLMSYQPLSKFTPANILVGNDKELIPYSQRPNITLYPQNSQGGTMSLPFIFHKQWCELSSTEVSNLGRLTYKSFGVLRNANSVSGTDCDITVYAWAENLELVGPTVLDALHSQEVDCDDEYSHQGTLSKPASAISRAMGTLSEIPFIKPFATATSMVAGAIGNAAANFGFTNVPVIDDVHFFKNSTLPHLAATDIGNPVEKLTVDSKNELSIDPAIAGIALDDELNIAKFCARESYLTSFEWTPTDASGDMLFNILATPVHRDSYAVSGGTAIYPLPMYMAASLFDYWRGDMIFRFKILCTKYHKGRLEINWCPNGTPGSAGNTTNEIYTKILDITKNTDIEFRVPYLQSTAYKQCNTYTSATLFSTSTAISGGGTNDNGVLSVKVVNKQTSPSASSDITVLVYAKCAENFEFASPQPVNVRDQFYAIQSKEVDYDPITSDNMQLGESSSEDPNLNLIYQGEKVESFRSLFNRSVYYFTTRNHFVNTSTLFVIANRLPRFPVIPGFDADGLHSAIGPVSGLPASYNFVNWLPMTWLASCFIGHRGSVTYHVNCGTDNIDRVTFNRDRQTLQSSAFDSKTEINFITSSRNEIANFNNINHNPGTSGLTFTNPSVQTGLSANVPMYSRFKIMSNGIESRTLGATEDGSNQDSFELISSGKTEADFYYTGNDLYVSAGPDFSLIFFLNAPTIYRLSTGVTPTP